MYINMYIYIYIYIYVCVCVYAYNECIIIINIMYTEFVDRFYLQIFFCMIFTAKI